MTTDLSALTTAAGSWDAMAAEFTEQEKAYRRDVDGISMGRGWSGLSAEAANGRFHVTLREFGSAQTEAKAVASLLRDAHTQFAELRGKLKAARQEAVDAGMKVSEQGFVSFDTARLTDEERRAVHQDPGHAEAARSWQERLQGIVRQVTDADEGVRIALRAVVVDADPVSGGRGFNGQAQGDVEKYEGETAEEALERLGNGETLSDKEIADLHRAFRDNQDDPAFSRTLLDGLGADGTIRLTNELNDLIHVHGGDHVADHRAIETGLANALASATRDSASPWYREWREDMREAGVERHATDAQGARLDKAVGYQSLVTLMQHGDGYSARMLSDLTDDMIAAEKENPDIWQLKHEYSGARDGWFANDPVDGMLGIMSHDPETAARYLGDDQRMKYLVTERDWDVVLHEREGAKASTYAPGLDGDDHKGFGAAPARRRHRHRPLRPERACGGAHRQQQGRTPGGAQALRGERGRFPAIHEGADGDDPRQPRGDRAHGDERGRHRRVPAGPDPTRRGRRAGVEGPGRLQRAERRDEPGDRVRHQGRRFDGVQGVPHPGRSHGWFPRGGPHTGPGRPGGRGVQGQAGARHAHQLHPGGQRADPAGRRLRHGTVAGGRAEAARGEAAGRQRRGVRQKDRSVGGDEPGLGHRARSGW
ncbi:hypothetical protein [Streptomyces sp. NPDC002644]